MKKLLLFVFALVLATGASTAVKAHEGDNNSIEGAAEINLNFNAEAEIGVCEDEDGFMATGWVKLEGSDQKIEVAVCQIPDEDDDEDDKDENPARPEISNIEVSDLTDSSSVISWDTDMNATSKVYFGTSTPLDLEIAETISDNARVREHSMSLSDLEANTTYYFVVESSLNAEQSNKDKHASSSVEMSFTTLAEADVEDTTAPVLSDFNVSDITVDGAVVNWETNEDASSKVYFGTEANLDLEVAMTASVEGFVSDHSVSLADLEADTTYYVVVESADEAGNVSISAEQSFKTLAEEDTSAPVIAEVSIASLNSTSATISWETNEDSTSRVYFGTEASLDLEVAASVSSDENVTSHSIVLADLGAGTTYYFVIESEDAFGNSARSSEASFITLSETVDGSAPVISDVIISDITSDRATINWLTDEAANSKVYYGTGSVDFANALQVSAEDMVKDHALVLSELEANTTYWFVIESSDEVGNMTRYAPRNFSTLQ